MSVRPRYKEQVAAEKAAEILPSEKFDINNEPATDAIKSTGPAPDEASARLQGQLADLKRAEEMQRQAAEQMQREQQWLQAHPELLQHPDLTQRAVDTAHQQGHRRGTDAFLNAVKLNFDDLLNRQSVRQPDYPPAPEPSVEHATPQNDYRPTPTMQPPPSFRPLPEPDRRSERASIVSAPVSREVPSAGGARTSRQIRLSAEQRDAARLAGISEVEYARQVQRLEDEKRQGNYGEQRYR